MSTAIVNAPAPSRPPVGRPSATATFAPSASRRATGRRDADVRVATAFRDAWPTVYSTVLASTRDPEAAADAAQEAFARLVAEARADRFPDNPKAWLCRTAMNVAISSGRRAAVARRSAPRLVRIETEPGCDLVALARERGAELATAMAGLSGAQRVALVMAAQGLSGKEIAERLHRTHGATRCLMSRARGRLRRLLDDGEAA